MQPGKAPFEEAGRRPVRLEMRGVEHQAAGRTGLGGKGREDAIEDAHSAPADEAVVKRLVRPVGRRRVTPLQPVADDVADAADHMACRG